MAVVNKKEGGQLAPEYTARKTFINYLANMELADDLIIQFTDHTDVKILKHYKRKLNLLQKRKIIERLIERFNK